MSNGIENAEPRKRDGRLAGSRGRSRLRRAECERLSVRATDGDRSRLDAGVRRAPPSARSARPIALTLIQREDELRPDLRRKICGKASCAGTTTSTLFKSNRPLDVWGRLRADNAADQPQPDRLVH